MTIQKAVDISRPLLRGAKAGSVIIAKELPASLTGTGEVNLRQIGGTAFALVVRPR